jgi:hypothetical protein
MAMGDGRVGPIKPVGEMFDICAVYGCSGHLIVITVQEYDRVRGVVVVAPSDEP